MMAIKEEFQVLSPTTIMEIDLLKSLGHHPSIVGFKKVAVDDGYGVYLVMELMETDLRRYIQIQGKRKEGLGIARVKGLMKQLLEGVKFLHDNKVMHWDLKTSNLLVNGEGGLAQLKICDFGLSTRFKTTGYETSRVGTVGYRAPELMEGLQKYSCAVDMWGVGCIMAELVLKKPLFQGKRDCDVFVEIRKILGDEDDQPCSSTLRDVFASAGCILTEAGFDLLHSFMSYDPSKRITAQDALNHLWFKE